MGALPPAFQAQIIAVFKNWQDRTARCLAEAQSLGSIGHHHDVRALAAFFWTGWDGAVLRAKLERNGESLRLVASMFFQLARSRKEGTCV